VRPSCLATAAWAARSGGVRNPRRWGREQTGTKAPREGRNHARGSGGGAGPPRRRLGRQPKRAEPAPQVRRDGPVEHGLLGLAAMIEVSPPDTGGPCPPPRAHAMLRVPVERERPDRSNVNAWIGAT
jgi:hypothetical protein